MDQVGHLAQKTNQTFSSKNGVWSYYFFIFETAAIFQTMNCRIKAAAKRVYDTRRELCKSCREYFQMKRKTLGMRAMACELFLKYKIFIFAMTFVFHTMHVIGFQTMANDMAISQSLNYGFLNKLDIDGTTKLKQEQIH